MSLAVRLFSVLLGLAVAGAVLSARAQVAPPEDAAAAARASSAADPGPNRVDVRVRGGDHDSYGRMVFDWDEQVEYRVGKKDDNLHVAFSRPASFDTEPMMPALRDYVGQPAPGPHGYRMVIPLKGTYQIEDWRSGTKLVIDLKKVDTRVPEESAKQAPTVRLRAGEHDGYGRLVFDWPHKVGYDVKQDAGAGTASVRFRRPARIDLSRYANDPPSQVLGLSPIVGTAESGVELQIPTDARVRHFAEGTKVVVDVMAPKRTRSADAGSRPAQPEAPAQPQPAERAPASQSQPSNTPQPVEQAALPEPKPERPADTGAASDDADAEQPDAETELSDGPLQLLPDAKPEVTSAAGPEAEPESGPAATQAAEAGADRPAQPQPTEAALDGARDFSPTQVAQGIVPKPGETPPQPLDARLPMPWAGRTAAAFAHAGELWLAFDGKAPEAVVREIKAAAPKVNKVERRQLQTATVLQIDAGPLLRARPELNEGTWRVALSSTPALPTQPITPEIDADAKAVRLPVEATGSVIDLKDPATGSRFVVVPVAQPGRGVPVRRQFPEFTLLATHTGIAVLPHADYVTVKRDKAGVTIAGERQPLMLSESAGGAGGVQALAEDPGRGLLDLEAWRRSDKGFVAAKQDLQSALSKAAPAQRPLARLEIARFYFAHGMAVEALGALDLYAKETPRHAEDPQVLLMRGASQLLAGEWAAAAETLGHPALDGVAEALPWQAAYAALTGADRAAVEAFDRAAPLLEPYPDSVRKQLHLWATESRLALGDAQGAGAELAKLRDLAPNPAEAAEASFLDARRQLIDGQADKAEALWREAAASTHPPTRARARFVLAERELAAGDKSVQDVIGELERLRYAWRGDEFEAVLLHRLADLYVEDGRYNRALAALRQAASHLPDSPLAQRAATRMRDLFTSLFLDGAADRMPPLKALALYESYRELTPAGPRGDEMISRLADRLVGVDLLTRAARLLDGQVRHRLSGQAQAETGARLAAIRLLDRAPEQAIEALERSAQPTLPAELAAERRHLRARALSESGDPAQALSLLAGDDSEAGLKLAADIHSKQGDWGAAATTLQRLLPEPPKPGTALADADAERVMRAAVAMTLAGQTDGLLALSERYGPAMAQTQHAETFGLLDPSTGGGPVTVAKQLAEVQQAKAFMSSFQDRLEAGSTGATQ